MTKSQLKVLVGQNVKKQRIRHGMTQNDLAEILGMQPSSLALMERGLRGTTFYTLFRLSKLFGLPVDIFFL